MVEFCAVASRVLSARRSLRKHAQIPEQRVSFLVARREGRRMCRCGRQHDFIQSRSETAGLGGRTAAGLVHRRSQRDELFLEAADVSVVFADQCVQRSAAEPEVRGQRLGINRLASESPHPLRRGPGAAIGRAGRLALARGRDRGSSGRRSMCWTGASHAAAGAFAIRLLDDQRHAQRGIVERHARARFAVIPDDQNRRLVVETPLLQRRRESARPPRPHRGRRPARTGRSAGRCASAASARRHRPSARPLVRARALRRR